MRITQNEDDIILDQNQYVFYEMVTATHVRQGFFFLINVINRLQCTAFDITLL